MDRTGKYGPYEMRCYGLDPKIGKSPILQRLGIYTRQLGSAGVNLANMSRQLDQSESYSCNREYD